MAGFGDFVTKAAPVVGPGLLRATKGRAKNNPNPEQRNPQGGLAIETSGQDVSGQQVVTDNEGDVQSPGAGNPVGTAAPTVNGPTISPLSYKNINISGIGKPSTGPINVADVGLNDSDARASQAKLLALLEQASAGNGPSAAQATLQAGTEANIKAALAQSASAKGASQTATARQAVASGALANQQSANQAAVLRAQEMQSAYELNARVADSIRNTDVSIQTANIGKQLEQAVKNREIDSDEAKTIYTNEVAVEKENVANQLRVDMANASNDIERERIRAQLEIANQNAKAARDVAGIQAAASRETARAGSRTKPMDILSGLGSVAAGAGAMGFGASDKKGGDAVSGSSSSAAPMEGTTITSGSDSGAGFDSGAGGDVSSMALTGNQAAQPARARVQPAPQYSAADVRSNPQARLAMLQRMGLA